MEMYVVRFSTHDEIECSGAMVRERKLERCNMLTQCSTITSDTSRIKGAQPFIVIEQGFIAIIKGAEDLAVKTTKLGTTPVAVTVCE